MMALINVVSHCEETVVQLGTVLRGRGHEIKSVVDSKLITASEHIRARETELLPELFVVDLDSDPQEAADSVGRLSKGPITALTPVLVAASPESARGLALACAYGASGLLRNPFTTVETVPDTERALAAIGPAA
jgi:CheY-like chemotaxis protein